jgi:hypothetical protein
MVTIVTIQICDTNRLQYGFFVHTQHADQSMAIDDQLCQGLQRTVLIGHRLAHRINIYEMDRLQMPAMDEC